MFLLIGGVDLREVRWLDSWMVCRRLVEVVELEAGSGSWRCGWDLESSSSLRNVDIGVLRIFWENNGK